MCTQGWLMTTQHDIAALAYELSIAQRRAIMAMRPGELCNLLKLCPHRRTRLALTTRGLVEPVEMGSKTSWPMIRLTLKGEAAQASLNCSHFTMSQGH